MKRDMINRTGRGIALILLVVFSLTFLLTGCDVEQLLQDLATDYVWINIENGAGKLLSESDENEQIYTYQIDATVTNGYALDLTNAVITLNVPNNVEITKGGNDRNIKEKSIAVEEENSYSWIVKIPMTFEDQNIEYSVSVSSDVSSTVEANGMLWVDGKNKNDNRLDFNTDTWKFRNYGEKPIPLTQSDYDALMVGLNNSSRSEIKKIIKNNSENGYCYGMAVTSVLAKMGRISAENIDVSAKKLHSIEKTKKAKSVIGYYWITQYFDSIVDERASFISKSTNEKLTIIENNAKNVESGGNPFVFSFYSEENEKGGHAVVAYSHENGYFEWNGNTYDSRILIYDNNAPKWSEKSCLYYKKGTDDWYIPEYPNASGLTRALSDLNIMDVKNIEANSKTANSYITARGNEQLNIYATDGNLLGTVDGTSVTESDSIVVFRQDGMDNCLTIVVPREAEENSFVVEGAGENEELDISVKYDNFYLTATGDGQKSMTFNPNGNVSIEGETEDFTIEIAADEGYYSTDWYQLLVSGDSGTNPKVEIADNGYILSGEELKDITIYAENNDTANKLNLKTDEKNVYITQEGDNLCVKSDEDDDGNYETVLVTGTTTTPDNPTSGGIGGGFESIFKFNKSARPVEGWIIYLILGIILLITVVTGIIVRICSKKKKDELKDPALEYKKTSNSEEQQEFKEQSEMKQVTEGICVLTGSMEGSVFSIKGGMILNLGKDVHLANIVFSNSYSRVSRIHCSITYIAKYDKYFVIDCSSNGTFFEDGQRLIKNKRTPVERGTILKLADDDCKIKLI